MSKFTNPLDGVRVAAPCPAEWGRMVGDERMRYCDQCELHVYNLSDMTKQEAEALIANTEGRLCVRFYRRGDGTIITRNCPVGLSALKRRATRIAGAAMTAVLGFFAGVGLNLGLNREAAPSVMGGLVVPASQRVSEVAPTTQEDSTPPVVLQVHEVMGTMSIVHPSAHTDYGAPMVGQVRRQPNRSK